MTATTEPKTPLQEIYTIQFSGMTHYVPKEIYKTCYALCSDTQQETGIAVIFEERANLHKFYVMAATAIALRRMIMVRATPTYMGIDLYGTSGGGSGGRATFTSEPKRKYKVTLAPLKWEAGAIGSIVLWFADTPYGRILVGRNGRVNFPWLKDDCEVPNNRKGATRVWAEEQYRTHVLKAFVKVKERKK